MDHNQNNQTYKAIYWPFVLAAASVGIVLSWGVLSGDEYGRVNLLLMLMLYFFVPVISILITLAGFVTPYSNSSAKLLIRSGLFKLQKLQFFRHLQKQHLSHLWLIQQSQIIALVFAVTSILVFLFLLLFTDMTFIWRSTILKPEHLHPVLELVALPWGFAAMAQPDMELLQASQHFRLENNTSPAISPSQWWPFVLAVQLTYSFLPRLLMYIILGYRIKRSSPAVAKAVSQDELVSDKANEPVGQIIPVKNLSGSFPVLRWDAIPDNILDQLRDSYHQISEEISGVWHGGQEQIDALSKSEMPIILVKAWEPPMGELSDQLRNNKGYILPVMWRGNALSSVNQINQEEWLRFASDHQWQLLTLEDK